MLERAKTGNFVSGFSVGGNSVGQLEISCLLFTDDTLFFFLRRESRANLAFESSFCLVSDYIWFKNKFGEI